MATGDPECVWLSNYGGYREQSAAGGSAVEFFGVFGMGPNELRAAQALNPPLPSVGNPHPDPRFAVGTSGSVGTVQTVRQVQLAGPLGWIAMVRYSAGGTFNFSLRLGSRFTGGFEETQLPIIGGTASAPISILPLKTWSRASWGRTESTRYFGDVDDAIILITRNLGRYYAKRSHAWVSTNLNIANRPNDIYRLTGADIVTDAGNNTRIDTHFFIKSPIPAFPVGTYAGQTVAIPEVPADGFYSEDSTTQLIKVIDPIAILDTGEPLPWLP